MPTTLNGWIRANPAQADFAANGSLPDNAIDKWAFYSETQEALLTIPRSLSRESRISRSAEISGKVVIEPGAVVLPGAFVEGPAFIGRNVIVGNSSLVRRGTILANDSTVGNHCNCTAVLFAPGVRVTHFCGVSRSILEQDCCLSAFVITGTLRADARPVTLNAPLGETPPEKRGCIIGQRTYVAPHVTISPGVQIGHDCFIGSFVVVNENVPAGKRYRIHNTAEVDDNNLELARRMIRLEIDFEETELR